ncbi:hypothetical protein ACJMK2_017972 [Sinanodonta woodiana]|uniref:Chitin-binding type-2 domain-containing protein n=1 Tax=Sinanodonta woodiana TaxID=1069815 RepID=A0ABD3UCB8_SINWO
MTFNVSVKDADIEVSVYISDTQCNHHGTYSILAISDENGFEESFASVNVIAQCPCQVDLSITSTGEITCSFPHAENTSISIQKVSGDMQTFLVNGSEIIRPIDLQAKNGFSASWSTDGTLNIKLVLGLLNCSHEGDYNISVKMNGTSTVYEVYLHVIDNPQTPVIEDANDGIIEDKGGRISCRAMTGCNKAHLKFELSRSGNDIWDLWRKTNQSVFTLNKLGWETQFLTTISTDQVTYIDKRKFRCSYMFNRKIYTSNTLCIRVIPANFCQNKTGLCDHLHPYSCNKYISCQSQTWILERSCPVNEYFVLDSSGCHGKCLSCYKSSSSDTTKMVSISSGNTAAETELDRKRRLPMPPALKPQRPKKNFTLFHKLCKELCSYCVASRLILSIPLMILTLGASGAFIYLLVTNIHEPVPVPTPTDMPTPEPRDAGCPCELEYELNFDKELQCELKVIGNTTISFNKVSGENINPILYQTGIHIPDNVPERGRFSAMWNPSGTLTASINFLPVQCHDEGNYSLTVTSRVGTQLHYMYVKVIDHQYEPTISTLKELFEKTDNGLQCHAITGCKKASLMIENTQNETWEKNLTTIHYEEKFIWKTNATLNLTEFMIMSHRNRCFRCTYSIEDKKYYSKPLCMQIIPVCNVRPNKSSSS